jgi:hypothetical protein
MEEAGTSYGDKKLVQHFGLNPGRTRITRRSKALADGRKKIILKRILRWKGAQWIPLH